MTIVLDETSGALGLRTPATRSAVELDMLDPSLIAHPKSLPAVRERARATSAGHSDRNTVSELARRLVYALSSEAEYHDTDEPGVPGPHPVVAYAPALILRDRSQQGLVDIFSAIVDQMSGDQQVPEGLRPLVDPDHQPAPHEVAGDAANSAGAVVTVDDEPFLPMPVNETQLRILRQVDTHAQTLVQGPPGTGKTHTAAALISHLLAQGLRVLVTAHTDRALREIRGKLPTSIRPLAVSVMGTAGEDMAELRVAVERLAAQASEAEYTDPAGGRRSDAQQRMAPSTDCGASGRVPTATCWPSASGRFTTTRSPAIEAPWQPSPSSWTPSAMTVSGSPNASRDATGEPPMTDADIVGWYELRTDPGLAEDEVEAAGVFRTRSRCPILTASAPWPMPKLWRRPPSNASPRCSGHPAFESLRRLPPAERAGLRSRMAWLANEAAALQGRRESWVREALADVRDAEVGHGRPDSNSSTT